MAYTTGKEQGGTPIVEVDTSIGGQRQEVVVRGPAGAAGAPIVPQGATNLANSQVTAGAAAATLAIARATRREVIFKNIDTVNTVWIGVATVTALNGMQVLPGESIPYTYVGLLQVIAPAGAPIVCVRDEYY